MVRYDNRALQILPIARAKRHAHPRERVVVREPRTGQPLSARQMAARARWRDDITVQIARKAERAATTTRDTG